MPRASRFGDDRDAVSRAGRRPATAASSATSAPHLLFADDAIAARARQSLKLDAAMSLRVNPPAGALSFESDLINARRTVFSRAGRRSSSETSQTPASNRYRPMAGTVGVPYSPVAGMRSLSSTVFAHAKRQGATLPPRAPGPKYITPMPGHKPRAPAASFGKATRFQKPPKRTTGPSTFRDIRKHSPAFGFGSAKRF